MSKEQAILNAAMVMNYLATYERQAYLTMDINPYEVRVHYFKMDATDIEVEEVEKKLEALIIVGTETEFDRNEYLNQLTFNIIWQLWK